MGQVEQNGPEDVVIVLAANKYDLMEKSGEVSMDAVEKYASQINSKLVRTSARTGEGIKAMFESLVTNYVEKKGSMLHSKGFDSQQNHDRWRTETDDAPKKKKCC